MTEEERQRKSAERKKRWRGVMYGGGTPSAAHGGGAYTAKAVHVEGPDVSLRCAALSASNSGLLMQSLWFNLASEPQGTHVLTVLDPNNDYCVDTDFGWGAHFVADTHPSSEISSHGYVAQTTQDVVSYGSWHHLLVAVDTNHATGQKQSVVYLDDELWDAAADFPVDNLDAFVMPFSGREFYCFDDGFSDGITGDFADFFIGVGLSVLVDGAIPEATRRLFISTDKKPVDPAVAVAELGSPTVLFSGDSITFATNQGTGGVFTLTGALTNASTSPSD